MKAAMFFMYCCVPFVSYLLFSIYYYLFLTESETESDYPILLWWTDFGVQEETVTCNKQRKCIVSSNSEHLHHKNLLVLMFYGSFVDLNNFPMNRHNTNVFWALFHEESPKNLPALRSLKLQQLFNITATFSRHSTFPITFQYLKSLDLLTSNEYYLDVHVKNALIRQDNLAPVLYIQSACDTPIKRDSYVKELMKYVNIDSYGGCLNNKRLPVELTLNGTLELYSESLLKLSAKYKFIIAIENAKCDDYITEKLWRPLIVGAIPIYLGAKTIKDYLPNGKSAILIEDFETMESLGEYITSVNNDENLYNSYMNHKLKRQLTNDRLLNAYRSGGYYAQTEMYDDVIPAFQCFVCDAVYDKRHFPKNSRNVFDCEYPEDESWHYSWKQGEEDADKVIHNFV